MAFNNNQQEPGVPIDNNSKRETVNHLPKYFRTDFNKKFLNATLDQMVQPGVVEKINGFYGKKNAKAFNSSDIYIGDITDERTNYQLEPAVLIKDNLDNVDFYADYNDYINYIKIRNGNEDHAQLNEQEFYAWNPNIDWDKFINFRNYYWMPTGPELITINGQSLEVESEYTVTLQSNDNNYTYIFSPDGQTNNPSIKLYRGQKYIFDVSTPNYPISFVTKVTFHPGGEYNNDFTSIDNTSLIYDHNIKKFNRDGTEINNVWLADGKIEFIPDQTTPDTLFYISQDDPNLSGIIKIYDIVENTEINVEKEIIGKTTYKTSDGWSLSNGMKVAFVGNVYPEVYKDKEFFVEGVGSSINLVDVNDLELSSLFVDDLEVPFDNDGFDQYPFSEALGYASEKDYITISRQSKDGNLWTKYNRWFHIDVIEKSLELNNQNLSIDQSKRAKRPIIEFYPNLKLHNFGVSAKKDIALVDDITKDIFSDIEGSLGYIIDGVELTDGMRVLFLADEDILVKGKIFVVNFITVNNRYQITLIEAEDSNPVQNEVVLVRDGLTYKSKNFYYNGNSWILGQQKTNVNQEPVFDMFDSDDLSFNDNIKYPNSQFAGNKIFTYQKGTGNIDSELGFALKYANIINSGDILFKFNLLSESFFYTTLDGTVVTQKTNVGFLRQYFNKNDYKLVNGWITANQKSNQPVIRQYIVKDIKNNFEIDMYQDIIDTKFLWIKVYKNNYLQKELQDYNIVADVNGAIYVQFAIECNVGDNIIIKTRYESLKNENGYYELPYSFERNPSNDDVNEFTLGEVIDHGFTIIEELGNFTGEFPGKGNLRDLGNLSVYGRKFIKHSVPSNLIVYNLLDKDANILESIDYAKNEYSKFKRKFINIAENLGYDGPVKEHVDLILKEYVKEKNNKDSFFFSDMVPFEGSVVNKDYIVDTDQRFFALSAIFNNNSLSSKAVSVYLNGNQLIYEKDYIFNDQGFIDVFGFKKVDDIIEIYEYNNTNGNFVPPTPTKLGLYPKFQPEVYIDTTIPSFVDTSTVGPYKFYGYEKNEPNDNDNFGWFYPLYITPEAAEQADVKLGGTGLFSQHRFVGLNRVFYMPEKNKNIAENDSILYELWDEGVPVIQGHDGSITTAYKDYRDNLLLELEKRIFNNIKIDYDEKLFDIYEFLPGLNRKTGLSRTKIHDPMIGDFVSWTKKVNVEYTVNRYFDTNNSFTYNFNTSRLDNGETSPGWWREIYRYVYDTDRPHTHPWEMLGFKIKPKWWEQQYGSFPYTSDNLLMWEDLENGIIKEFGLVKNSKFTRPGLMKMIPVDSDGKLLSPSISGIIKYYDKNLVKGSFTFSDGSPVESAWKRSSDYVFSLLKSLILNKPLSVLAVGFDRNRQIRNLSNQIIYSDIKNHIRLEEISFPYNTTNFLYTSGIINYIVDYQNTIFANNYLNYIDRIKKLTNQICFRIGGYTDKAKFKLILDSRTPLNEGNVFVPENNYNIVLNTSYPFEEYVYSGVIIEKQPEGFYISGYDTSFTKFKYFNVVKRDADTTINVGGVSKAFVQWESGKTYAIDSIVKVGNDTYYRCKVTHVSTDTFDNSKFVSLPRLPIVGGINAKVRKNFTKDVKFLNYGYLFTDIQDVVDFLYGYGEYLKSVGFQFNRFVGSQLEVADWSLSVKQFLFWCTQSWDAGSLITVSPGADKVTFYNQYATVGNVTNSSAGYSIFKADGTVINTNNLKFVKDNYNNFSAVTTDTDGIYFIKIPLVYKEHVVIIDNKTEFNDIIYDAVPGYRQERIRVLGYRTDNWTGGLNIEGFFYDNAIVQDWQPWHKYFIGDIVKFKEFYYVAASTVDGSESFDYTLWKKVDRALKPKLYTNFDYRIDQFKDFYDLDSDNLDTEQQKLAQHLIGYQKRKYLENIINNDVSQYKFYQGFIQEKGTKNALTKLFDVLASADKDSFEFYEEWAVREGIYGAVSSYDEVEYILNEEQFRLTPQPILLTDNISGKETDLIYRIPSYKTYSKNIGYNHKPFQTLDNITTYVKHAGFVDPKHVNYILERYESILDLDHNILKDGDYLWIGFVNNDWNIYQYTNYEHKFTSLEIIGTSNIKLNFEFTVDNFFKPNQIVGVQNVTRIIRDEGIDSTISLTETKTNFNGFYVIDSVLLNSITITLGDQDVSIISEINEKELFGTGVSGIITYFNSKKVPTLDKLEDFINTDKFVNQKYWVTDTNNKQWGVYQTDTTFKYQLEIENPDTYFTNFGYDFAVNKRNTILVVGVPDYNDGKVLVYNRATKNSKWKLLQELAPSTPESEILEIVNSVDQLGNEWTLIKNSVENIDKLFINGIPIDPNSYNTDTISNKIILQNSLLPGQYAYVSFSRRQIPYRFGSSVDISYDDKTIVVGSPDASKIYTRIKGEFSTAESYNVGDIVSYSNNINFPLYYKAVLAVLPAVDNQTFEGFFNFNNFLFDNDLIYEDSYTFPLLFTGSYNEREIFTNHIIIRLPNYIYDAISKNDRIILGWNNYSNVNQTQLNLQSRQPFDGEYDVINSQFLNQEHAIIFKFSIIFKVENARQTVIIGQSISSETGIADVEHVISVTGSNDFVIYCSNVRGYFDLLGVLKSGLDVIGDYEISAPLEDNPIVINNFTGFIAIQTPSYYVTSKRTDTGRGFFIKEILTDNNPEQDLNYFNILDYYPTEQIGNKSEASLLYNFSYRDFNLTQNGNYNPVIVNLRYFAIRTANNFDLYNTEKNVNFYLNKFPKTVKILKVRNTRFTITPSVVAGETLKQKNNLNATAIVFSSTVTIDPATINSFNPVYNIQVQFVSETDFNFQDELVGTESGEIFIRPIAVPVTEQVQTLEDIGITDVNFNDLDVWQKWDGYIVYRENRLDSNNLPYVPYPKFIRNAETDLLTSYDGNSQIERIGQTIRELSSAGSPTDNTAEVMFVQRISNSTLILWLDNVQGNWGLGNDFDDIRQLSMDAHPTGVDIFNRTNIYAYDREFGYLESSVLPIEEIGKFLIIDSGSTNSLVTNPQTGDSLSTLKGLEYWLYTNETVLGLPRLPQYPSATNPVWNRVYKLDEDTSGTQDLYEYEGMVSIYTKFGADYVFDSNLLGPDRKNNYHFGSKVKLRKNNNLSRLFVESSNPARLYFIKNGSDYGYTYNWEYATAKNFKGGYTSNDTYFTGDIVFVPRETTNSVISEDVGIFDGTLFEAITNNSQSVIVNNAINTEFWKLADELIDYVGYIPNTAGMIQLSNADISTLPVFGLDQFGLQFDVSGNAEVLGIFVKYIDSPNQIIIFRNYNGYYRFSQIIEAEVSDSDFGQTLKFNADGSKLVIGSPTVNGEKRNEGRVYIYNLQNTKFVLMQTLASPLKEDEENFGTNVGIEDDFIFVTSLNSNLKKITTFDNDRTSFDNSFTTFRYEKLDKGVVFWYQNINGYYVYADKISYQNPFENSYSFAANAKYNNGIFYVANSVYKNINETPGYIQLYENFDKKFYSLISYKKLPANLDKIKKVYLYNVKTKKIIRYLDYIDPLQGKIAGPAEQNITFKLHYDPAVYNNSSDPNKNFDKVSPWTTENIGKVWWDLSTVKYYYPYMNDITFSTNYWNKQFLGSSIDCYEWIETIYSPEEYDALSKTIEGQAIGISGSSKYGKDTYTVVQTYNQIANKFENKYYFWVSNKDTIPNLDNRNISVSKLQNLMRDPISEGYEFVSLIAENEFAIYNCEKYLNDEDIAISIQIYNNENQTINTHYHYDLLTVNYESANISTNINQKWIDSLVGYDEFGRRVPDESLSDKYKYGNLFDPRQSWFVNRRQALKQYIERINYVLKDKLIIDSKNLSSLNLQDDYPKIESNLYDLIVNSVAELESYAIAKAEQAEIELQIVDGKISLVYIKNAGRGYLTPPTYEVVGQGQDLELEIIIDSKGSVSKVTVINAGSNYNSDTYVVIRKFTALVLADETILGKWSFYERNYNTNSWVRIQSQGYNTNLYWNYIDWYADGYDSNTPINYIIDYSYELTSLKDNIGDIVKINMIGAGSWLLLKKINNQPNVDYTVNYETIGRENGTIKFSEFLYNPYDSRYNYDLESYDLNFYDTLPSEEIRIIANAIKNDIFIDELKVEYNNLLLASLRYILSEQKSVDWLFKTSFVRIKHNVGSLRKDVTFNNDNLSSYEDYVKEVKPYKSKIREYISSYDKIENNPALLTDFDLPPSYSNIENKIIPLQIKMVQNGLYGLPAEFTYPNKNWFDNSSYVVTDVKVADPGYGYIGQPTIILAGGGGTGAVVTPIVGTNGQIVSVEVINEGSGYFQAPTAYINGDTDTNFKPALLSVILGRPLVRSMLTKLKFDRLSKNFVFSTLEDSITETVSGSKYIFNLEWPISLLPSDISVYVNEEKVLPSQFVFENVLDTTKSYSRFKGKVTLLNPPANYSIVTINYKKDVELLSATDRINYFYQANIGQFGNNLPQILDGIDYGGVEVKSFDFVNTSGWDKFPYFSANYDVYDLTYEDHILVVPPHLISLDNLDYKIKINWTNFAKAVNALVKGDSLEIDKHNHFYSLFNVDELGNSYEDPLNGNSILNVLDELISEQVVDENGNLVLDSDGNPTYQLVLKITINSVDQIQKYGLQSSELNELAISNIDSQIIPKFNTFSLNDINLLLQEQNAVIEDVKFVFREPLSINQQYNFYVNGLRIDDINYGVDENLITNPNATIQTLIFQQSVESILIRDYINEYNSNDVIILRKPNSDGSFIPSDLDLDTLVDGGNIAYSNAKGIESQEIIIDGDNFVTPLTSKGPEENVPGLVQDTLDIKVFERPIPGVANIMIRNYIADGVNNSYEIDKFPLDSDNLIVKINGSIVNNYVLTKNKTIVFETLVSYGKKISIILIDYTGNSILDVDTIEINQKTNKIFINARWEDGLQSQVTVNGMHKNYILMQSDKEYYDSSNNVVIKFNESLNVNDVVRYVLYSGTTTDNIVYSSTTIDTFVADGSTNSFSLSVTPTLQEPAEWYTMVFVNNNLLNPGYTETFILTDSKEYFMRLYQVPVRTLSFNNVRVFLNTEELIHTEQWTFSSAESYDPLLPADEQKGSLIRLKEEVGVPGDTLRIYVNASAETNNAGGDYKYGVFENEEFVKTPGVLHINYDINEGDKITVYQFSNHDSQRIDWQSFDIAERTLLSSGVYKNSYTNTVTDLVSMYVGFELEDSQIYAIYRNGFRVDDPFYNTPSQQNSIAEIQSPNGNGSFYINFEDIGLAVTAGDLIKVEQINTKVSVDGDTKNYYELRQMRNGIIPLNYEAVDDQYVWVAKNGVLLTPSIDYIVTVDKMHVKLNSILNENDNIQTIHFSNSKLQTKFGWRQFTDILNRNHYHLIDGQNNITLEQELHWYDKIIVVTNPDSLPSPTIDSKHPGVIFIEGERIEYRMRYGNVLQHLRRGTLGTGVKNVYEIGTELYNQSISTLLPYKDETTVINIIADGISNEYPLNFIATSVNEFEVFVGGHRLRKTSLDSYQFNSKYQDSPEGDIILPPEFDISDNSLILNSVPAEGVKITIIKRVGKIWKEPGKTLAESNSVISKMIRSVEADLPR